LKHAKGGAVAPDVKKIESLYLKLTMQYLLLAKRGTCLPFPKSARVCAPKILRGLNSLFFLDESAGDQNYCVPPEVCLTDKVFKNNQIDVK
jgi:hypothetical protein